jgi:arylsulfatase A-like enzyme
MAPTLGAASETTTGVGVSAAPVTFGGQLSRVALGSALLGAFSGVLVTCVDLVCAFRGDVSGSRAGLVLSMFSLMTASLGVLGALLGIWSSLLVRAAERGGSVSRTRRWVFASLAGLPLLAGTWAVPLSWLDENAASLDAMGKRIVIGVYLGLLLLVVCVSRLAWWAHDRYRESPTRLPPWHWPLCAVALALGAACYWADGHIYVDLYDGLHYGWAGCFVLGVTCCALGLRAALRRRRSAWLDVASQPGPRALVTWAVFLLACAQILLSNWSAARAEKALVYSKAGQILLRYSDFDNDGYSSLLGGLDCAPFDARVGPKQFDLPGDGVDEDCTGSDARWPRPQPSVSYPIPDARGYNVLFITVDTLRADRTSVFGNPRKTTPNLERLASQGLAFERAYSQGSKTFESMPAMFTGLYLANLPRNYKHRRVRGRKKYMYTMTDEGVTLPQLLSDKGYQTRGIVALDWLAALGLDRGLDKFEAKPKDITRRARKFLRGARQPFLLWLHYFDPHEPYNSYPEHDFGPGELDRYDSEVAHTDDQIGELLDELEQRQLADKTIVVLTADHGEEFHEHGGQFHTNKLHQELLHVPLIIKVPGTAPARSNELVEVIDIMPTLCEALAWQPSCAGYDGQSLWAALAGKRDRGPGFVGAYSEAEMQDGELQRRSLLTPEFRLTVNLDTETVELFDAKRDPGEQRNLALQRPDVVAELRDQLALRPYRRLAAAFAAAQQGNSSELVEALPRLRAEPLLARAVQAIAKQPSRGAKEALERLKDRPGLGDSVARQLEQVLQNWK